MALQQVSPQPMSERDDDSTSGIATPTETTISSISEADSTTTANTLQAQTINSSIPWPGFCYIIRCAGSASVITLKNGAVTLSPSGGHGNTYWECIEQQGWLGFKDPASGLFLGHNIHGRIGCWSSKHQGWENFCARARPEGGFVLLMTHWDKLWPLRVRGGQNGEDRELEKVGVGCGEGLVWDFVKVR